jgi:cyclopropane-fatty-acyl-phospholipid synthase
MGFLMQLPVSAGLEHFCSIEEYKAGKQDEVYHNFFYRLKALLPTGGSILYADMVFDKNMMPLEEISVEAPKDFHRMQWH